jgi:hypothetical protein
VISPLPPRADPAVALPLASTRRIFAASACAIGAVKLSVIGRIGMHCASLLTRSHVNDARNAGRTRNAIVRDCAVAMPVVAAIPRPHTSLISASAGSVRAHASVTRGESGASRSRRNFSWSLPVAGSRNRKPRERPALSSSSTSFRYDEANDLRLSRIVLRSSPVTRRTPICSLTPAATQCAFATIVSGFAGASSPRMKTWFSSMREPSHGRLRTIAGPPVVKPYFAPPSFSVNVQRTPAGRSRAKS